MYEGSTRKRGSVNFNKFWASIPFRVYHPFIVEQNFLNFIDIYLDVWENTKFHWKISFSDKCQDFAFPVDLSYRWIYRRCYITKTLYFLFFAMKRLIIKLNRIKNYKIKEFNLLLSSLTDDINDNQILKNKLTVR